MSARFADSTVIITGAASGLGAECARQFASEGARLVLVDLNAEALAITARAIGGDVVTVAGDASLASVASKAADIAMQRFNSIDVLIANAGIDPLSARRVTETSDDQWEAVMNVNVKSAFLFARATLPSMIAAGRGAIVATGSIASIQPSADETVYSVSKAALLHLTRCIALDYAEDGIRANCICPGFMEAVMVDRRAELSPDRLAARSDNAAAVVPLKREGSYEEIARSVLFLASPVDAGYITGTELVIDGGLHLT